RASRSARVVLPVHSAPVTQISRDSAPPMVRRRYRAVGRGATDYGSNSPPLFLDAFPGLAGTVDLGVAQRFGEPQALVVDLERDQIAEIQAQLLHKLAAELFRIGYEHFHAYDLSAAEWEKAGRIVEPRQALRGESVNGVLPGAAGYYGRGPIKAKIPPDYSRIQMNGENHRNRRGRSGSARQLRRRDHQEGLSGVRLRQP